MLARQWISELNAAVSEYDLVAVLSACVKHIRGMRALPDDCLPPVPGNAVQIREAAARLQRMQLTSCVDHGAGEAYRGLATLFALAVERLSFLQARGLCAHRAQ